MIKVNVPGDYGSYFETDLVVYDKSNQQAQTINMVFNPKDTGNEISLKPDFTSLSWLDGLMTLFFFLFVIYGATCCFCRGSRNVDYSEIDGSYNTDYRKDVYRDPSYRESEYRNSARGSYYN